MSSAAKRLIQSVPTISHLLFPFRMVRYSDQLSGGSLEGVLVLDARTCGKFGLRGMWRVPADSLPGTGALPTRTRIADCMWDDTRVA